MAMKKKTLKEQLQYNVDQYVKLNRGEPNTAKVIRVEFMDLVEQVSDKNSGAFETLTALEETEKGDLPRYETVDELFEDLNDESDSDR